MFMRHEINAVRHYYINTDNTGGQNNFFSLPVKTQGNCYSLDIAESKYDTQIAPSPSTVKGEGIKLKNCMCNTKVMYLFLITAYTLK